MDHIEAAIAYIQEMFAGNADGHGFDHSMRVYQNALFILDTEPQADRFVVLMAALLHDVDDHKLFSTENNANARRFLAARGMEVACVEQICQVINSVSFSKNKGKKPASIEGRIVQDADRLDAIGAIGIARTFAFGGKHGRPLESSIDHFHEKLLLLKDLMNTEKAREMAETRHTFMEGFLREWSLEVNGQKSSSPGVEYLKERSK